MAAGRSRETERVKVGEKMKRKKSRSRKLSGIPTLQNCVVEHRPTTGVGWIPIFSVGDRLT